jgi:hypothetical protein
MKQEEVDAACWAALEAVAKKETRRDALVPGAEYDVSLKVSAELGTKAFAATAEAHVVVNSDGTRLVSHAAPAPHLVAYILSLLSSAKRKAILHDLPDIFAARENLLPDVDAGLIEAAEGLLSRLRAKIQQPFRGGLSTSYTVHHLTQ